MSNIFKETQRFLISANKTVIKHSDTELFQRHVEQITKYVINIRYHSFSKSQKLHSIVELIYNCAAASYAINSDSVGGWDEVISSNMSKVDAATGKVIKRADGKVLKPDGFKPPNLSSYFPTAVFQCVVRDDVIKTIDLTKHYSYKVIENDYSLNSTQSTFEDQRKFMIACDQTVDTFNDDQYKLYVDLVDEEYFELIDATNNYDNVDILDALLDIIVVATGAAYSAGFDILGAWRDYMSCKQIVPAWNNFVLEGNGDTLPNLPEEKIEQILTDYKLRQPQQ